MAVGTISGESCRGYSETKKQQNNKTNKPFNKQQATSNNQPTLTMESCTVFHSFNAKANNQSFLPEVTRHGSWHPLGHSGESCRGYSYSAWESAWELEPTHPLLLTTPRIIVHFRQQQQQQQQQQRQQQQQHKTTTNQQQWTMGINRHTDCHRHPNHIPHCWCHLAIVPSR